MTSLVNQNIDRIYKCTNEECGILVQYTQRVKDPWRKKCPNCHKNTLLLETANLRVSVIMDLNKPKTIGSLAEKNTKEAGNLGKIEKKPKKQRPWWRSTDKIDYTILKNPNKYIHTGEK